MEGKKDKEPKKVLYVWDFDETMTRTNVFLMEIFDEQVTKDHAMSILADPRLVDVIKELVDDQHAKVGIVSNSYTSVILAYIAQWGLGKYFTKENIIGRGKMIDKTRTDRVLYLARKFDVKKENIVVIDDCLLYVTAHRKQGITCIHINNKDKNRICSGFSYSLDWLKDQNDDRSKIKMVAPPEHQRCDSDPDNFLSLTNEITNFENN